MRKNKIRILHVAQAAGGVDRYIRMLLNRCRERELPSFDDCRCGYGAYLQRGI